LYFMTNVYPGVIVSAFVLFVRPTSATARRVLSQWLLVSLVILIPIVNLGTTKYSMRLGYGTHIPRYTHTLDVGSCSTQTVWP
jgi:hypothetical protein